MKEKVIKLLTKYGCTQKSIDEMVEKHFDYAVRTYKDAKASYIASVISSLG